MKRIISLLQIVFVSLVLTGMNSCSNDDNKSNDNSHVDSTHDTITGIDLNDSTKMRFKKLVSAMPVPFDMLKKFSGAHLPFRGELLNVPENAVSYNSAGIQSLNLGVYGADLAYMISQ
ncbi:MAG TPA: hypothetical protein VFJ43_08455, partial [Bacteroidia bacterium]|nr:hypothetical protein [Bacteroidia bacterium]